MAAELLDGSGDGVWLVELASVSEQGAVASAISEALGITSRAGRPALETLLDALSPQHVLIVLDNCEHLIGACAKVADAICGGAQGSTSWRRAVNRSASAARPSTVCLRCRSPIATKTTSPRGGVRRRRAPSWIGRRHRRPSAPSTRRPSPLVVSICRRLDGMPLAIELAAARLRSMSLKSLNDRLDQRFAC